HGTDVACRSFFRYRGLLGFGQVVFVALRLEPLAAQEADDGAEADFGEVEEPHDDLFEEGRWFFPRQQRQDETENDEEECPAGGGQEDELELRVDGRVLRTPSGTLFGLKGQGELSLVRIRADVLLQVG